MSRLPLPFFLPGVAHKVFGGSILAAALTPQLFLALLLFSVYGIGRRAGGPWLGLAAAVIASGYPGVYQIARTHHDSLATSALAAAMICLLVYCRGFTRLRICALAGVTAYLSTLVSESVSFTLLIALIAAGPFAMEFVRLLRRCRSRSADAMRGMVGLALFLAPVCLLFGWDRIGAFMAHGQSSLSEVSAFALVGSHVPSSLHGFVSLSAYFFRITFATLQPLMTLWLIAGAVLLWRAPRGERLAVALSVAVPLVLLSVMPKKADQYIVPLCPGLALTTALGLRGIRSLKLRRWAMGLAALCGLMMPLFYALVPSRVRDRVDLDQISPLIKTVVETSFLPLGDKGNRPHLSHRTRGLPLAIAGNELVAHDLKNNPRGSGPRRVAVFGPIGHYVEGFRYVVELTHPEMFVIDFLQGSLPLEFQYQIIAQLPAYKFDYLVFIGEEFEDDPDEFPYEGWDAVEAREDYISWVTQPGRHGLGESAQKEWEARVRRFAADLLKRQWKRVELSAGPIYQAVGPGR